MKKLITFNDFLTNILLEKEGLGKMNLRVTKLELMLSPRFKKILKQMNHVIADTLLELSKDSEPIYDKTFVDLGTEPNMVSFIQSSKVIDFIEPDTAHGPYNRIVKSKKTPSGMAGQVKNRYTDLEFAPNTEKGSNSFDIVPVTKNPWISDVNHVLDLHYPQFMDKNNPVWTSPLRSEVSINKFIAGLPGPKFVHARPRAELAGMAKPDDQQSFCEMFIALVEEHSKKIVIVEGQDIRKFYSRKNYFKDQGTLGGSCMKDLDRNEFMTLYADNPDKVKMVVLFPEESREKIIGRALLWTLDEPKGQMFMDRIYTADDKDQYTFINYATKHGWWYKSQQAYGPHHEIIDTKDGSKKFRPMMVTLEHNNSTYPYIDTLSYAQREPGEFLHQDSVKISNDSNLLEGDYVKLTDTGGSYRE